MELGGILATLWMPEELSDLHLPWEEFHAVHPRRTRESWSCRRKTRRGGPAKYNAKPEDVARAEKLWELMSQMQELVDTKIATEVNVALPNTCAIAFLSDAHIGGIGTDHKALLRDIDIIATTPDLYVYLGGDAIDNFILPKLMNASREQMINVAPQWKLLEDILRRLGDKVICVGDGNHTAWTQQLAGFDYLAEICSKWNLIYTGEGGLCNLTIGNQLYRIFRHHKFRFSSYMHLSHTVLKMWETGPCDFDIGCVEHHHRPHIEEFWKHGKYKIAIRTGSYKINDAYANSHGFYGASSLVPTVVLNNDKFKMTPFLDMNDASLFLKATNATT